MLGPDPRLEPRTYRRNADDGDRLMTGDVNNLPSTVGGGGFHADAKLPRFSEEDFALRTTRGRTITFAPATCITSTSVSRATKAPLLTTSTR